MSLTPESVLQRLEGLAELAGVPERYVVALSGGLDSTVLLHMLAESREQHRRRLLAVHVNHQLHDEAAAWSEHCAGFCASLKVEFRSITIDVDLDSGQGTEGAARTARYAALSDIMAAGDWLLSAHHRDDQAETLLLNLMRGSGPAGLAGIGEVQPFASGWLVRPLLPVSRVDLDAYARANGLTWIDDPSNEDRAFDRNFLRHDILPALESRWPGAAGRIGQSARLSGEAALLLDQLADADFRLLGDRPDRLRLAALRELAPERQRNVLRYVVRELGLPAPPASCLASMVSDLIPARDDAQPVVEWPGAQVRRYRDSVYVLPTSSQATVGQHLEFTDGLVDLGAGLGQLSLTDAVPEGLSGAVVSAGLDVRFRTGGEKLKPIDQKVTKTLKNLLQEEGVVPWMRDRLPLVYSGDQLVAVADLWIAADAASRPGTGIAWKNRPPLH